MSSVQTGFRFVHAQSQGETTGVDKKLFRFLVFCHGETTMKNSFCVVLRAKNALLLLAG